MADLIDRQMVNDVFVKLQQDCFANGHLDEWFFLVQVAKEVNEIPSAKPETAIPLSWIETHIEWLKSLDNAFSTLTAIQISVMVNKWKDEQDESD